MNIAQSVLKILSTRVLNLAIRFIGITFFARELGSAQIGVYFLFQALLGILEMFADLGIRGATEKRLSESQSPGGLLTTAILLKLPPLLIILGAIFLVRPWIDAYVGADIAWLLAVGLAVRESALLLIQTLNAELRVGETAAPRLSEGLVWVIGGVIFVEYGFGAQGLIYSFLIGTGVMLLWTLWKLSTGLAAPSVEHARSLVEYAKFDVVAGVGWRVFSWMDVLIIGYFLTQSLVGAYEIAWKLAGITIIFSQSIRLVIFPQISAWEAEDRMEDIERLVGRLFTPALIFVIPSFFGVALLSREILGLVYGAEYTVAWLALVVLMGHKVIHATEQIIGRSLQAIDKPDLAAYGTFAGVAVNLVLNVVLVWQFGIIGAAVATFVSYTVTFVLRTYYLSRFLTLRFPYTDIAWSFAASIGMALVVVGIQNVVAIDRLVTLLAVVASGAVVYTLLILGSSSIRLQVFNGLRNLAGN